jgi:ParB family chromosome partitioning protein
MQNATLTTLSMDDIIFDSSQPRKFFDESALKELTKSVQTNGILQPIMVRPGAHQRRNGKDYPVYVIVCGERRYRAAYEAGLEEIPVVIRNLDDAAALEIQIVENLQRKDVNPMEEGLAFEKLSTLFTIEEIAYRVGKSAHYVAQRMSLAKLTDKWQQLMYDGTITLTQAYKLARIAPSFQDEVYKETVDKNGKLKYNWQLDQMLDNEDHNLAKATFNTKDAELYPEAGACTNCPYNSAANNLLFPDLNKKKICHNSACWSIKTSRAYKVTIEEKAKDPDIVFVHTAYSPSKEEKAKIQAAEELGVKVLSSDDFETVDKPDELEPWEEWLENAKFENDFDEMDEKEQKQALKDWKEEYADEKLSYESQVRDYEEALKTGTKAFVVTGDSWRGKEGETILIVPKKNAAKKVAQAKVNASAEQIEIDTIEAEIEGIRERSARNKELDREKVFKILLEKLRNSEGDFLTRKGEFEAGEQEALILAMAQRYNVKEAIEAVTGKDYEYNNLELYKDIAATTWINELMAIAARAFIIQELVSMTELDPERYGKAAALYEIAKCYMPSTVEQLEIDQLKKTEKRESNVAKRLKALEDKKAALVEKIRDQNIESGKKAQAKAKKK